MKETKENGQRGVRYAYGRVSSPRYLLFMFLFALLTIVYRLHTRTRATTTTSSSGTTTIITSTSNGTSLVFKSPVRSSFMTQFRRTATVTGCLIWKYKKKRTKTGKTAKNRSKPVRTATDANKFERTKTGIFL